MADLPPTREDRLSLSLHGAISEIPAADWNLCAGGGNPFVSHEFLSAIEDSGSTGRKAGWIPWHAALRDGQGAIRAVVPLYEKMHSYGEYVFDHAWAQALERTGQHYYPKMQVAVPFTPVPGPRLLRRPGVPLAPLAQALAGICSEFQHSSVHVTFCSEDEWQEFGRIGWLQRTGVQFHWQNQGWKNFEDFLGALSSRKRKSIRHERAQAGSLGLRFATLRGADIKPAHWDAFYEFYQSTIDRKWGSAYLTRDFFARLSELLGDRVVLMMAWSDDTPVAGALNLLGNDTLYGRNWGARGHYPFLHFELCYYRAIDFALEHGLKFVEAGAQGEHKIQRGYEPVLTYSAHWIAHKGLASAVAQYLEAERIRVNNEIMALRELSPYRHDKNP
jgi:predicted N-acyltransferase